MKAGGEALIAAAARLYTPVLATLALAALVGGDGGGASGFATGLVFALAPLLHALAFGADASRRAFPAWAARLLLALGVLTVVLGEAFGPGRTATLLAAIGAFAAVVGAAQLIVTVFIGRAPALPDADW